jgi:hypothetical protein
MWNTILGIVKELLGLVRGYLIFRAGKSSQENAQLEAENEALADQIQAIVDAPDTADRLADKLLNGEDF